ncbi:MAG: heme-copper oxidase subunit III, partial [Gemmatimonadetes bacterium]|nr:heme-copper oxidase subunit III [Gemmatimonadota bacterium]
MTQQSGRPPARTTDPETQPGMPMEILGMYLFIASELILFITLLFIMFWLRSGLVADWPPPDQPRLPIGITGINTVFLLVSGYTMHRAYRAVKQNASRQLTRWLMVTCVLGVVFLTVQGFEWIRLIQFGLSMTSSLYGAMFYSIIGLHAVHVLATVLVLLYLWVRSSAGAYTAEKHTGVVLGYMFWLFVVLIWPILYVLV